MPKRNDAVVKLVTFCLGSVAAIALALALLFAGAAALAVGQATDPKPGETKPGETKPGEAKPGTDATAPSPTTFSGMITDAHCTAKHPGKSRLSGADCVRVCVRSGSAFVILMDGDKVYTLHGDQAALGKFASQRATVQGKLTGDTIDVTAIAAPQESKP